MKHTKSLLPVFLSSFVGLFVPAHAVILAVDFNEITATTTPVTSPTETGPPTFQSFNIDRALAGARTQTFTTTLGALTVSLPSTDTSSRDRGAIADSGSFTYGDLLRDGAVQLQFDGSSGTAATNTTLKIAGLTASTAYSIQLYSLNKGSNNGEIFRWYNRTPVSFTIPGSEVNLGDITNVSAPAPTSNNDFSLTSIVTSNQDGELYFRQDQMLAGGVAGNAGTGFINGFVLAVPEPSSAALGLIGSLALLRRRRA